MLARSAPKLARAQQSIRFFSTNTKFADHDVVILAGARTPVGAFNGALSSLSATQLGTVATKAAIARAGIKPQQIDEVIFGNVVSAGVGQAPASQAAVRAGVPTSVPTTTINKVCSSGMKSITFAAQSIATGQNSLVLAGGFESMSNIPYYLLKARSGYGLGNGELVDGCIKDGLWDAFDNHHMGMCGEDTATKLNITRQDQDTYALETYRRAQEAVALGHFAAEITPVEIKNKKGEITTIAQDEEPSKLIANKVPSLKPAFKPSGGTVTAANASKLNDGACAVLVASGAWARQQGLTPIARIMGFADAQRAPIEFPIAPALAIPKALSHAGISAEQVDFYEINEAFSVVALANQKLLNIDPAKLNVFGGAVALGHPIGMSGARLVLGLANILKIKAGKVGVAAICNGGGGATAVVIERL